MRYIDQRFSADITRVNNQALLNAQTLLELTKIFPKETIKNLKKVHRFDYRNQINRQTVTVEYLVKANMRIAIKSANHYYEITGASRKKKCDINDVISECLIGLTYAAKKYIETKDGEYSDYSFGPYAKRWTDKYARDFINNGFNPVKLTTHEGAANVLASCTMRSIDDRYSAPGGESDMVSPIFNELRTSANQDELSDLANQIVRKKLLMSKLLNELNEKEMNIISMMYGLSGDHEKTASELAKDFGTRPNRIMEVHDKALNKIRTSKCITPGELMELKELAASLDYSEQEFKELYGTIVDCPWESAQKSGITILNDGRLINNLSNIIKDSKILDSFRSKKLNSFSEAASNPERLLAVIQIQSQPTKETISLGFDDGLSNLIDDKKILRLIRSKSLNSFKQIAATLLEPELMLA